MVFVEVEASDNDDIIFDHKKKVEENKNFSNVFLKELKTKNIHSTLNDKNKVSYLNKENSNIKKDDLSEKIQKKSLKKLEMTYLH